MKCRRCGGNPYCKDDFVGGRQRYRCKSCHRHQMEVDSRMKYPASEVKKAVYLYLDGLGIRCMARMFTLLTGKHPADSTRLLWIRQEGLAVERRPQPRPSIEVCERDELSMLKKDCKTRP